MRVENPVLAISMRKTRKIRFWIQMLVLTGTAVCAFALFSAPPVVRGGSTTQPSSLSASSSPPIQMQTYEGMITDTRCSAKHSATIGLAASNCVIACVHSGERFALVDGDAESVRDGDTVALKKAAGQRVRIVGSVSGTKIAVTSVTIN